MLLINTDRNNLLKPLQMVTGIVEKKQTMPILSNVIVEKKGSQLIFIASDKEMQITATSELEEISNDNEFSLTVSARKFHDILRSLNPDTLVSISQEDEKLLIKTSNSRFNLHILPSDDFPRIPEDEVITTTVNVPQNVLKRLLSNVQFAIADQDLRYYLNGVLLTIDQGILKTVGTDSHRLALASATLDDSKGISHEAILPRKAIQELLKLLNDVEENVKIDFFAKKIRFTFSNVIFITKVIDGKYINYSRVIPDLNTKQLELNRQDFLQALQRVAILSNPNELFRGVRLVIDNDNLRIISRNTEQEEAVDEIAIQYEDNPMEICLKLPHLLDLLNHVTEEKFLYSLASPSDSVLITIPGRDDFRYVVMPIKI